MMLLFSLVGHPYAGKFKLHEHAMVVDMSKSLVKPTNILLTLKENNEYNVTTIKQVYNYRYAYKRSIRGLRDQQLMILLDHDNYIHWSRCHESSDVVNDLF